LVAGVLLLVADYQTAAAANPNGEWDASAIWNLRARFLASGGAWRHAVSQELGGQMAGSAHPGYPLFLSSFVALQWVAAGDFAAAVPITASLLFSLALLGLLIAALAGKRSVALGLLAGLVLVASELFASQAASQYSDLLQGLSFLAALFLLDAAAGSEFPARLLVAAGLAAGLAPWIKNEGQPFAIAALGVAVWRFRRDALWFALGAIPGVAATALLKLIAEGREGVIPATVGEALAKIADLSRWWQALVGFGAGVVGDGPAWAHPVILAAALAITLRFVPASETRARVWLGIPAAATLAAEYGLFLVTTADLKWHLSTSMDRLLAQMWPSLIWLLFSTLRAPESYFRGPELAAVPVMEPRSISRKKRRARA
jgi:hypothetical protein